ncbi:MAG: SPOR domain-containing protein [Prevotella sp.]|nr:SPOR domain-containing protein [Prevotella sp.]
MKKYTVLCAVICAAMLLSGCKSKESAYKQAYLKAKQQDELAQQQQAQQPEQNVVSPMEEKSANQGQVVDNADNITVRQEAVDMVSGSGLKNFSVVVGSFGLRENADGLQQKLKGQGYDAQVVVNNNVTPVMYRVVATTFDTKVEAAASRNALNTEYPGAWLLYAK